MPPEPSRSLNPGLPSRHGIVLVLMPLVLSALSGCGSILSIGASDLAGVAGAGLAAGVTRDAATAAATGLGAQSLAREGVRYLQRRVHRTEQDAIAGVAGGLEPGSVARWSVSHTLPLEDDARGDVVVSRVLGAGTFHCKEIVFSVETTRWREMHRAFYVAMICQDGNRAWRWASAEPSVGRWGGLQ